MDVMAHVQHMDSEQLSPLPRTLTGKFVSVRSKMRSVEPTPRRNEERAQIARTFPPAPRLFEQQSQEDAVPTFIKMAAKLDEPVQIFSDEFLAVALFSGIGLVLALVAASCGVPGVWL